MRVLFVTLIVLFVSCHSPNNDDENYLKSEEVKLSQPMLDIDSLLFYNSANVSMHFGLEGSEVFYRLDREDDFTFYNKSFDIDQSTCMEVFAAKKGFIESDTMAIQLIKLNNIIRQSDIHIDPQPNEKYPGHGIYTLNDHIKGTLNFREGKKWLGFDNKKVIIEIKFNTPTTIHKVYISTLSDVNSWIFSPQRIRVYLDGQMLDDYVCDRNNENEMPQNKIIPISFDKTKGSLLRIEIENIKEIPDWHPGKGLSPWLFIDEISVE